VFKFDEFQNYGKDHFDAAVTSAATLSKGVQAIATAVSDYAKKSLDDGSAFVEKLTGAKSIEKAFEVQTDFAKSSYETFVAESTKIGELYTDLAKEAYKPFESYLAKMPKVA